uniref:Uncharacterized protein n=1 Tax=Mycena chlorophos TaxID=658473 RepID=A0ABQ0L2A7_MYCCL|nr:predicted protein [Mycena chlorophos]
MKSTFALLFSLATAIASGKCLFLLTLFTLHCCFSEVSGLAIAAGTKGVAVPQGKFFVYPPGSEDTAPAAKRNEDAGRLFFVYPTEEAAAPVIEERAGRLFFVYPEEEDTE